jgi:3-oxoacyl-[acyl-carrier-protein] synthase-1
VRLTSEKIMRTMPNQADTLVVSAGACTSIGSSLPSSAAAARAGIATFRNHPFMVDTAGKPMVVGPAPYLSVELDGLDRWLALALPAAEEALEPLRAVATLPSISVLVGLPDPRPGLPPQLLEDFSRRLAQALATRRPIGSMAAAGRGHASGLLALKSGIAQIASGRTELCLIGGVDSYLDTETLEWIEGCEQLHSAGEDNNPWGFIPSEGAGFCLLAAPQTAARLGLPVGPCIRAVGCALEPCLIKTETVCTGVGLTRAFGEALAPLRAPHERVDHIVCDMNGEPYRAEEFAFATMRHHEHFIAAADFVAPADCWGDVGAASGPLFIGLAMQAYAKAYRAGPRTLVWASSEGGDRVAALVDFSHIA